MKKVSSKQTITGTRAGYVIRFTCQGCHSENTIICKMPKDFYRETRDATCSQCRNRSIVLTPGVH